jgi:hypothetical protein
MVPGGLLQVLGEVLVRPWSAVAAVRGTWGDAAGCLGVMVTESFVRALMDTE